MTVRSGPAVSGCCRYATVASCRTERRDQQNSARPTPRAASGRVLLTAVLGLIGVGVVVILGVTIFDLYRRPTFRRLAFRNALRRKNEAVLVVLGSLFGTAIVTSAFAVGD